MSKRDLSLDLIRTFAIVGVVATHTEDITSSTSNYLGGLSWWFANTIHSLISVSVPLFVMLTGSLLLSRQEIKYSYIIQKTFKKLFLPFVFWWLFYVWRQSFNLKIPINITDLSLKFVMADVGHLYYLLIAIGLYLVSPKLKEFLIVSSQSQQQKFLWSLTLISIVCHNFSFLFFKNIQFVNLLTIFLPFISYLLWGYFLARKPISKKTWWAMFFVSIGITLSLSLATYLNTSAWNNGFKLFWTLKQGNFFGEPFFLPVFVLAGLVFLLLKNAPQLFPKYFNSKQLTYLINQTAISAFGIYLIHPVIIDLVNDKLGMGIQFVAYPLWLYYSLKTLLVFCVSGAIIFVSRNLVSKYSFKQPSRAEQSL